LVVIAPSIARVQPVPTAVQPIGVALLLLGAGAQVYRYRRVSAPAERQQTKWVMLGVAASMAVFVGSRLVGLLLTPAVRQSQVGATLIGGGIVVVALGFIPVCIGIAVLRAGLWDVDLVINRALLYAGLTVAVVGIYVLVVWYLGTLLHTGTGLGTSLVATGVVAVVLQPLRTQLQRGVNRLTYGQRDEPYKVIAELGRRLEVSAQTQSVLTAAVETLAKALRLPYAAIMLGETGVSRAPVAAYGTPAPSPLAMSLRYGPDPLGLLLLGPRRPGEPFTPADLRLLEDLARQISTAAHAVTLAADLQRSRERLITAREEERRRLRRDLHDGLGPALTGLALKASSISNLVPTDQATASRVANEVYAQIRAAIADIRRLVYGCARQPWTNSAWPTRYAKPAAQPATTACS
jgi:signal transduction histidine kinase